MSQATAPTVELLMLEQMDEMCRSSGMLRIGDAIDNATYEAPSSMMPICDGPPPVVLTYPEIVESMRRQRATQRRALVVRMRELGAHYAHLDQIGKEFDRGKREIIAGRVFRAGELADWWPNRRT